jgi:predicted pyridoxine 5'-phosphate oxidase superfamily flavin-nucleotide-binding protein
LAVFSLARDLRMTPGFLRVGNETTLGFADFGGNRQNITLGNISENPRALIFLMEYANSCRIKLWGTLRVIEGDAVLLDQLREPSYPAKTEREKPSGPSCSRSRRGM